ncbi:SDR family oxidoreductase [Alphaproteobacteria bacterium]|nr:SDR family oxidoreductase [Alphaproteobacteria bacterium]
MSSSQHIAIVTGAGSGIGAAIAERLAQDGARVMMNDINASSLASVKDKLISLGISADQIAIQDGDVSDETDMKTLFDHTMDQFGDLSLVVNNAGILQQKAFVEIKCDDWDKMIAVHVRGCFLGCHFAIPIMLKRGGGVIINTASQLGQIGAADLVHYATAKAAIIGLTKSLAREFGQSGLRINAVAPGPINTDLVLGLSKDWRDAKAAQLPLGHFGEPSDVAATVAFLASEDARIYVGQTLGPNSGDVML